MNDISVIAYMGTIIRIGILIFFGVPLVRWWSAIALKISTKRFSQHVGALISNMTFYAGITIIVVIVLHECGFHVTALLGAAGIVGVALGFASQTTVSNIISGIFLLMERSFSLGDIIKIGDVTGYVEAIDLLSIHVRTLDNKMIRLSNEMMLKQPLSNLTYYPIKRIDCIVSFPYATNNEYAQAQIQEVIARNSLFLKEPLPVIMLYKIGQLENIPEIRMHCMVRVWVATEKFSVASAMLMQQLKEHCDKNNLVISVMQVN
jgi:small-conductance mechanosensitive channel